MEPSQSNIDALFLDDSFLSAMTPEAPTDDPPTFPRSSLFFLPSVNRNQVAVDLSCQSLSNSSDAAVLLSHRIFFASSLTVFFFGLIGNTLSLVVFSSKDLRAFSSNVYMLFLSISDTLYLFAVFFSKLLTPLRCWFLPPGSHIDVVNRFPVLCKLSYYLSDLFSDFSSCLILAFTIERYLAVYHPIDFKGLCSPRRALFIGTVVLATQAVLIAPYHFLYVDLHREFSLCGVPDEHELTFTCFYIVECILFRVTPVVTIAVLNLFIGSRVLKLTKERQRRRAHKDVLMGASKHHQRFFKDDRGLQVTIMLILVSTTHVILYVPVLIHFILHHLNLRGYVALSEQGLQIAQNYTRCLYIAGFAVNFLLYALSGKVFREQLCTILGRREGRRGVKSRPHRVHDLRQTGVYSTQMAGMAVTSGL